MKKQSQAQKRGNKTATSSQGQSKSNAVRTSTDQIGDVHIHAWLKAKLSDGNYQRLLAAFASFSKVRKSIRPELPCLSEYVLSCIAREVNRELFPGSPLLEIEDSVNQAVSLLDLASLKINIHSGKDYISQSVSVGIGYLTETTSKRLKDAFSSAHAYAVGRESVDAPL